MNKGLVSFAAVYIYILTFRVNILAIKNSKAFSAFKNNIKDIEYSY